MQIRQNALMDDVVSGIGERRPIVRPARPDDVDALAGVKVEGWRSTYADLVDGETLAPFLDVDAQRTAFQTLLGGRETLVLVAEQHGEVVGFGTVDLRTGYVDSLHVLPSHRSGGIGRRLLAAVAEAVRERGCTELSLHVVAGNVRARQFYERLGGEFVGSAPAEWASTVDEVHYCWTDLDRLIADIGTP